MQIYESVHVSYLSIQYIKLFNIDDVPAAATRLTLFVGCWDHGNCRVKENDE